MPPDLAHKRRAGELAQSFEHISSPRRRSWLIPGTIAIISFFGGVASNLIAAYIQVGLEPYRRWVWLVFGLALVVAVIGAIRDYRESNALTTQPQGIGREIARGWIENVIAYLLQSLRSEEDLLAQRKVLTWRHQPRGFAAIHSAWNLVPLQNKDSLEHFVEHHPEVKAMMNIYDQQRAELLTACQFLQQSLMGSKELRSLYERAKADTSEILGSTINSEFRVHTETEHLESLAESIVNRRHQESLEYVFRHAWGHYHDAFLGLRTLPVISAASGRVDRAGEDILNTARSFIKLLMEIRKRLGEKYDVPI